MKNKFSIAMSLAVILAMLLTSIALADNLRDDAVASGNDTFVAGGSTVVRYWIQPTGGCDASDGSAAIVSIIVPAGVTIDDTDPLTVGDQTTLKFTTCNTSNETTPTNTQNVTFRSSAVGDYAINAAVADAAGSYNTQPAVFVLHVTGSTDVTAPVVTVPANITAEATGPGGAVVTFSASALDDVDGALVTSCSPASGSTFVLGATTVTCSATDAAGNTGSKSFTVTVQDTTRPTISGTPSNITAEATSAAGAAVTYASPTASDIVDGTVAVSCSPASGSTFALATTTVNCSATDAHGNVGQSSFTVTVQDTTPPSVSCGTADSNWHKNDVSISCSASDVVGLANPADANFTLSTNVAVGTEDANASTNSYKVYDTKGNFTTAGPISGNMVDKKAPVVSCGSADTNWHAADQSVNCTATDGGSGPASQSFTLSTSVTVGTETANASTNSQSVSDAVGNIATAGPISGFMIDKKVPQLSKCDAPDGNWHNANVTLNCSYTDGGSGPATQNVALTTIVAAGSEDANAIALADGAQACDAVNNCATSPDDIAGNMIDLKAPTGITFSGSIVDGGTYYFNFVPAAPTCTALDGGSGLASCNVAGYSTAIGSHTLTATATDNVGNFSTATLSYTVNAWTPSGFFQPVDMSPNAPTTIVWNTVKNGSTVPLKFKLFAGSTPLTDIAYVNQPLKAVGVACGTGTADDIELTSTGGTSLRYDTTGGQFIYNWQTPKLAGSCYKVTVSFIDGSSLSAYFKLK